MNACLLRGARDLVLTTLPEPVPGPNEALIRLKAGGICGSDLHYFAEGGVGDFRLQEPLVLGHEVAGEVAAVGEAVTSLSVGDRVAVNPNHPCGQCKPCRTGKRHLCRNVRFFGSAARFPHVQGAFAEGFVASAANCHVLKSGLSYRAAACAEPLAVALHALERAGPIIGRSVFIAGAGPIGVLIAAAARFAGAGHICVSDLLDEPLAIARAMGASATVNVGTHPEQIEALAQGSGSFEIAFEASGHPSGLAAAITVAEPGATVVQVGSLPAGKTAAPLSRVVGKELSIVGSFRFDREYEAAVMALDSGRIDVTAMLTHEFAFSDVLQAFATAADKRQSMKVSLHP